MISYGVTAEADMRVTVIITTTCEAKRADSLDRAIKSAEAPVMLVVNGNRYDPGLLQALKQHQLVHYLEEGNLAKARHFGRQMVQTPFFGFLDDDDEYLPGSIEKRLAPMLSDASIDAVIGNGLDGSAVCIPQLGEAAKNPAEAMLEFNWLPSAAGIFRTATIGLEFFNESISYLEWTVIGFKLALSRNLAFVDEFTYRINNTPDSLSKQPSYLMGHVPAIELMMSITNAPVLRKKLERKLSAAHHDLATHFLKSDKRQARKHHFASIFGRGGLRYFPFTRKVF
jgi:hypothetical protein